ncbi:MAG: DUF4129 domain-containing protein [Gammaproteobacteria bacterium]
MRSRSEAPARAALVAAAFVGLAAVPFAAGAAAGDVPSEADVTRALERVKSDPNLTTERTVRTLKWTDETDVRDDPTPRWLRWLLGLFDWVAEAGRVLLWVAGALLIGLLALYLFRIVRARVSRGAADRFIAPSHVRDLDIRPESLPPDIGAAALALWERGEHRAALALLYRGLLSRLAHVHAVPIRDSSTEGECLALAVRHLHADRTPYVSGLVRIWQRAVYGGNDPETGDVRVLCAGFADALDTGEPA